MAKRNLCGLRVLVTGASSGIGHELSLRIAKSGGRVLATARREDRLLALQNLLTQESDSSALATISSDCDTVTKQVSTQVGSIDFVIGDLTLPETREHLMAWIDQNWGGLDILVNNAGSGAIGTFSSAEPQRMRKIMEIDFFAPVELTRVALPRLRKGRRPAILNIGSILALRAVPQKSEYCAAKFALRGWAEALRCELAEENIDVLQVHPSTTSSEFFDSLQDSDPNSKSSSVGSMEPAKVAELAIDALVQSKREMILSLGGKIMIWTARRFPGLLDRLLIRFG